MLSASTGERSAPRREPRFCGARAGKRAQFLSAALSVNHEKPKPASFLAVRRMPRHCATAHLGRRALTHTNAKKDRGMTRNEMAAVANQQAQRLAEAYASVCCLELFIGSSPITVDSPLAVEESALCYCAVVGFSGKSFRGSLVVGFSGAALAHLKEHGAGADRDALGELSNQLLGRLKNRLLPHDLELFLGIPVVLRGEHFSPLPRHELTALRFRLGKGDLTIWIEIESFGGFTVRLEPMDCESAMAEGASMMF